MAGVADCFPGYATRDAVVGVLADWGGFVFAGVADCDSGSSVGGSWRFGAVPGALALMHGRLRLLDLRCSLL